MAAKTLSPELKHAMKDLRLGQLLPTPAERIALAEKNELRIGDFLLGLFTDEIERRRSASASRRADSAGLDPDMVFDRWDKSAKVTFDRRVLQELTSLRFVEAQRNIVVLGPVGVGKTSSPMHSASSPVAPPSMCACTASTYCWRLLKQSRLDNSRDALMTELCTIDLLVIDDFALEPMTRDESRDIYQLFVERTGRAAAIITSNRDTADLPAPVLVTVSIMSVASRASERGFHQSPSPGTRQMNSSNLPPGPRGISLSNNLKRIPKGYPRASRTIAMSSRSCAALSEWSLTTRRTSSSCKDCWITWYWSTSTTSAKRG
jgi:DNA replication protein DnaC